MNKRWVIIESVNGDVSATIFLYKNSAMNHAKAILRENMDEPQVDARWHDLVEFGVTEEGDWSLVLVEAEERL